MFLFKKIISPFLLPLPLCLAISFIGLFLILFTKKQKTGRILVTAGLCSLTLLSYNPIPEFFIARLEHRYNAYVSSVPAKEAIPEYRSPVEYVVVLSGGVAPDSTMPVTSLLSADSLIRLLEGILIYRENPGSKLILSGGGVSRRYPESDGMAVFAKAIGVDEGDMVIESDSRDTKDQARIIKTIVGNKPFVLVTSAYHMHRSMTLFKKLGMNPAPAPAGFMVMKRKIGIDSFLPGSGALHKTEIAIHEYLGMVWAKLRGQI